MSIGLEKVTKDSVHSGFMRVLAGDIGGTKTRVGVFEVDGVVFGYRTECGLRHCTNGECLAGAVEPAGIVCRQADGICTRRSIGVGHILGSGTVAISQPPVPLVGAIGGLIGECNR